MGFLVTSRIVNKGHRLRIHEAFLELLVGMVFLLFEISNSFFVT